MWSILRRISDTRSESSDSQDVSGGATASDISLTLGRLPKNSPLARHAVSLAAGRSLPSIQPLVSALVQLPLKRWRERITVIRALTQSAQTEDDRHVAAAILSGILYSDPRESLWRRLARGLGLAGLLLIPAQFISELLISSWTHASTHYQSVFPLSWFPELCWLISVIFLFPHYKLYGWILASVLASAAWDLVRWRRLNRVRIEAARCLGRLGMAEGERALRRATEDKDSRVREAAHVALAALDLRSQEVARVDEASIGIASPVHEEQATQVVLSK